MSPILPLLATAQIFAQLASVPPEPTPLAPAAPPTRTTVVVIDDRTTKDQAPPAFIAQTLVQLQKRKGMTPVLMSEVRKRLSPRSEQALTSCGDDAGCLAKATGEMGGDLVVSLRLNKRDEAFFLAMSRINALRPQFADDTATLVASEREALASVPAAVDELFADTEQ